MGDEGNWGCFAAGRRVAEVPESGPGGGDSVEERGFGSNAKTLVNLQ